MFTQSFALLVLCALGIQSRNVTFKKFPSRFLFGVGTSAYQVEGAWNISGKGVSIWDTFTHQHPGSIIDRSNGDNACNSYYKIKEDVALIKNLGVDLYRFSLSWTRLLPTGFANNINPDGIRYYNELINELLENGIAPMITLFHWDLPQDFEALGGFSNSLIIDYFELFANVAFTHFGDRVKLWTTFNQPKTICLMINGGILSRGGSGIKEYLCAYNLVKAHARVYHHYVDNFKEKQKGRMGITLDAVWYEPASNLKKDIDAAERKMQFEFGLYANPIFHKDGDFPEVVKNYVGSRSREEGFPQSRLPIFTNEEIEYIKRTYDFLTLNHYTTKLVNQGVPQPIGVPSYDKDINVLLSVDPSWPSTAADWIQIVPWGFRKVLNWLKNTYGNPQVFVTENGVADHGEIDDKGRINYYKLYISAMLDAIQEDKVNIVGFSAWSLLDNFEWIHGYVNRFGLYHVDFTKPDTPRTMKKSAWFYKKLVASKLLNLT